MGTKNNPGDYDCYNKAEPDEPMFTLLGRDEDAPDIVRAWISIKRKTATEADVPKLEEAESCAQAMEQFFKERKAKKKGKRK